MNNMYKIQNDESEFLRLNLDPMYVFDELELSEDLFYDCMILGRSNTSFQEIWKEISCELEKLPASPNAVKVPDISLWDEVCLILSEKANTALKKMLNSYGEFLPLDVQGTKFFLFHPLEVVDVNEAETEYELDDGLVVGVEKLFFDKKQSKEKVLFKAYPEHGFGGLFCTKEFRDIYEEYNFSGLIFKEYSKF